MAKRTARERFLAKVDVVSGCWVWTGGLRANGYGSFWFGGDTIVAHRASYMIFVGPIPDGLQIDHLCRNRACVNPAHLEAVTCRVNLLRSPLTRNSINAAKTHCVNGHEFTPENTRSRPGHLRDCLQCAAQQYRRRRNADV